MRIYKGKLTTVTALALFVSILPAYSAQATESTSIEARAASLEAGDFIWQPQNSPSGDVAVVVSLQLQKAFVYRGEVLIGVSTISSGSTGHETPTGTFEILQKRREHYSNKYDSAPMPFMQRLTWEGVALHAGRIPGYPASHGCIRLPIAFARHLFGVTELGAAVHVVDRTLDEDEALAIATNTIRVGAPVELAGTD